MLTFRLVIEVFVEWNQSEENGNAKRRDRFLVTTYLEPGLFGIHLGTNHYQPSSNFLLRNGQAKPA